MKLYDFLTLSSHNPLGARRALGLWLILATKDWWRIRVAHYGGFSQAIGGLVNDDDGYTMVRQWVKYVQKLRNPADGTLNSLEAENITEVLTYYFKPDSERGNPRHHDAVDVVRSFAAFCGGPTSPVLDQIWSLINGDLPQCLLNSKNLMRIVKSTIITDLYTLTRCTTSGEGLPDSATMTWLDFLRLMAGQGNMLYGYTALARELNTVINPSTHNRVRHFKTWINVLDETGPALDTKILIRLRRASQ